MRYRLAAVALFVACVAAGPASQPANTTPNDYPALRKRVAELVSENAALRLRIDALVKELADVRAAAAAARVDQKPAAGNAAKPKRTVGREPATSAELSQAFKADIKIGQTTADVEWILGKPTETVKQGVGNTWYFQRNEVAAVVGEIAAVNRYVVTINFDQNDRVASFREDYR